MCTATKKAKLAKMIEEYDAIIDQIYDGTGDSDELLARATKLGREIAVMSA